MTRQVFGIGFLALCMGGCANLDPMPFSDFELPPSQIPARVKATIEREAKGERFRCDEAKTEDGKTEYKAWVTIGGIPYTIMVADDGTLLSKDAVGFGYPQAEK